MTKFECKFEEPDDDISVIEARSPKDAAIKFAETLVDRTFGDWTYVDVRPLVSGRKKPEWERIKVTIHHGPTCS